MHPRIPLSRCAGLSRPTHNYQTLEGTPTASSYKACLASLWAPSPPPSPATGLILGRRLPALHFARVMARDPAPYHRYRPRLALPSILSLSLSRVPGKTKQRGKCQLAGTRVFPFSAFLPQREREKEILIVEEDGRCLFSHSRGI